MPIQFNGVICQADFVLAFYWVLQWFLWLCPTISFPFVAHWYRNGSRFMAHSRRIVHGSQTWNMIILGLSGVLICFGCLYNNTEPVCMCVMVTDWACVCMCLFVCFIMTDWPCACLYVSVCLCFSDWLTVCNCLYVCALLWLTACLYVCVL